MDGELEAYGITNDPNGVAVYGDELVIEVPQIYPGGGKGDPNDLITLAIQVGRYTERYASRGRSVEHILPHTWKGTVDADILCRRVMASLPSAERALLEAKLEAFAECKRHNVIDAVGIAKWSLRRARAAVF